MMEVVAMLVVILGLAGIIALCAFFVYKASQMMAEETERSKLRVATRNAMLTDKHLAKLKRNKMRAYYRRARIW